MNNPLIQEVRDPREALAAKFDCDRHRICEDAMKREAAAGRRDDFESFLAAAPEAEPEPEETDRLP
jgi:hypothetical protein